MKFILNIISFIINYTLIRNTIVVNEFTTGGYQIIYSNYHIQGYIIPQHVTESWLSMVIDEVDISKVILRTVDLMRLDNGKVAFKFVQNLTKELYSDECGNPTVNVKQKRIILSQCNQKNDLYIFLQRSDQAKALEHYLSNAYKPDHRSADNQSELVYSSGKRKFLYSQK
jgi:hypothetical protein